MVPCVKHLPHKYAFLSVSIPRCHIKAKHSNTGICNPHAPVGRWAVGDKNPGKFEVQPAICSRETCGKQGRNG